MELQDKEQDSEVYDQDQDSGVPKPKLCKMGLDMSQDQHSIPALSTVIMLSPSISSQKLHRNLIGGARLQEQEQRNSERTCRIYEAPPYHLHDHHSHLFLLVLFFILNLRLGSLLNHFLHRSSPFLPDWFHGLTDHLTFYSAQRLDLFAWCVRLSRLLVGFRTHFKSLHFLLLLLLLLLLTNLLRLNSNPV